MIFDGTNAKQISRHLMGQTDPWVVCVEWNTNMLPGFGSMKATVLCGPNHQHYHDVIIREGDRVEVKDGEINVSTD